MQRKSIANVICLSLIFLFLAGSSIADAEGAACAVVRVKLSMGSPASVSFFIDGNYSVAGGGMALDRQLYTVKLESGKLNLYCGNALRYGGASIRLVQHAATAGRNNFIWMKNAVYGYAGYLGDMEFTVRSGSIMVVNHVFIEDYLYGVVPHEMNNAWPVEALKAQAVSARNYVLASMGRSGPYDVVDTSADQVYKGFNAVNTNAIRAVDETANMVLTCGGKLVQIFYSASNGGYTEIPQHVWTASAQLMPYHVIRQDEYDTANPFSLQEALLFPKAITDKNRITYQFSSGGAMATGSADNSANAEKYLKDAALSAVKSKGYSAGTSDDIKIVGISKITPRDYMGQHGIQDYLGNDACVCFRYADFDMNVLARQAAGGAPVSVAVRCSIDMALLADEDGSYPAFDYSSSALRLFTVEQTETDWRIYHRRYGHGIGLSQRGAERRAQSTDPAVNTYDKILAFYYPNTVFATQSYTPPSLTRLNQPDATNAAAACPNTTLNVRSSPSSTGNQNILGALPDGARLRISQQNVSSGWHKILYGSREGYVSASYVRMDSDTGITSPPGTAAPTPTGTPAQSGSPTPTDMPTPTPASSPGSALMGDVNGDGVVSISDYTIVRLALLGLRPLTGAEAAAADVNCDGAVSISDYTRIRLDILGLKKAS